MIVMTPEDKKFFLDAYMAMSNRAKTAMDAMEDIARLIETDVATAADGELEADPILVKIVEILEKATTKLESIKLPKAPEKEAVTTVGKETIQ